MSQDEPSLACRILGLRRAGDDDRTANVNANAVAAAVLAETKARRMDPLEDFIT